MKTKNDIHILFTKYLAEETNDQENEELFSWLTASTENMQEFIRHKRTWDNLLLTNNTNQPDEQTVFHDLKKKIQLSHRTKQRFIAYSGVAACLLVLFSVMIIFNKNEKPGSSYNAKIRTARGEQKCIVLPDQTVVWLNAESQLSYNTDNTDGYREVSLTGEALFEVAKDSLHPFIVKTQNISIKVLGTKFNVNSYENNKKIETTVIEGHVAVSSRAGHAMPENLHLLANDKAVYVKDKQTFKLDKVDAAIYSLWTQGQLCFKEAPLPEIIKTLERHFNINIILNDQVLNEYIFTATFEKDKSIEDILDVFKLTSPIDYTSTGGQISITLK